MKRSHRGDGGGSTGVDRDRVIISRAGSRIRINEQRSPRRNRFRGGRFRQEVRRSRRTTAARARARAHRKICGRGGSISYHHRHARSGTGSRSGLRKIETTRARNIEFNFA